MAHGPFGPVGAAPSPSVPASNAAFRDHLPCRDRFDPQACPWGEILPHSDDRPVMLHELRGLSEEQLQLANEEILARHGQVSEHPLTTSRSWYEPLGDVALSRLSPVERKNFELILSEIQRGRAEDDPQRQLPAAYGQWQGRAEFANGRTATIHGSDHRLRIDYSDGRTVLYLPREAVDRKYDGHGEDVYRFDAARTDSVLGRASHFPWLLSTDLLRELNMTVIGEHPRRVLDESTRCLRLSGSEPLADGGENRAIEGTACFSRDGIPMWIELSGRHDLEDQGELLPWKHSYRMLSLERRHQPESLFVPPSAIGVAGEGQ